MLFVNKLKVLTLMTCLVLVGQGFAAGEKCADGSVWGEFTTEAATKVGDYYEIDTPSKLAWFACVTTRESGTYGKAKMKLTQDINLEGKLFIPISESPKGGTKFSGTIDGQNHAIRGLFIKGTEIVKSEYGGQDGYAQNVGLVSVLTSGGVVENLVLEVSDIYASSSAGGTGSQGNATNPVSVGTLVGWMEGGTIRNCVVEGTITSSGSKNRVGGLAGNVWSATISDCVSNVSISASGTDTHVGGIVGALRKGQTVTLSSCVFDGDTLISTGGTAGGIVGYHEDATVRASNLYYTGDYEGTGKPKAGINIPTSPITDDELNSEETVCVLNKGTWNVNTETCSGATSGSWSEGQTGISMNGSDGYKVSFNANGGSFGSGAKIFKIFAKGATITADEITIPTRTNKKFAGWATTDAALDTTALGIADSNKTLYAVWYDFYTVTFKITDSNPPYISVPKHGHVSAEGFTIPSVYYDVSTGDSIKYFFTGWAYAPIWLDVNEDPSPEDTLHLASIDVLKDTTLFPVWTRAETYSVTFDATLHGKTYVRFVKKVNQGDKVAEPDVRDVFTDPGYKIVDWCTDANCPEGTEYDFDKSLDSNLTLYAKWELEKYAITYVMNGGTNSESNRTSYTVESDPITFAEPTYSGNTFNGWFYDAGFTDPATGIATNSTTGNKTLYAKWTPIVYTIEYLSGNDASATVVADTKYWGVPLTLKGNEFAFQREGYVQDGWSLTDGGARKYVFGASYEKDEDLILYPHWILNASTIAVKAISAEFPYDGNDHAAECSVEGVEGVVPEGYSISTSSSPTVKKVSDGSKEASCTLIVKDASGTDVTQNFTVVSTKGSISVKAAVTSIGALTILTNEKGNEAVINGYYGGVDAPNFDENEIVSVTSNINVRKVTLARTFSENKISTLYVPFEISADKVVGAKIYKFKSVEKNEADGRWKFKVSVAESIKANTPYVILPSKPEVFFDSSKSVILNTTTAGEETSNGRWEFKGTYELTTFAETNDEAFYVFAGQERAGTKLGEFVKSGGFANPMRAYLVYNKKSALSKSAHGNLGGSILLPDELDIEIENEKGVVVQTGKINTVTGAVRMDCWFDLKGRRLNSKPTVKGTYYKNGKKVIIR